MTEKLWEDNQHWLRACTNFSVEIKNNYSKSDRIRFIKRTNWFLPGFVHDTTPTAALTSYTDANESGKAGYKSENLGKVEQSPYSYAHK